MIGKGLPPWATWLMLLGLAAFIAMVALSVRRNRGIKRTLFSFPYSLWIVVFTLIPLLLIGYYAFTDRAGAFTLDNFRTFWDSNFEMHKQLSSQGYNPADLGILRGNVNVDTLIYSLWMALLCTAICLLLGYPVAYLLSRMKKSVAALLSVFFIVPMWMNFLLRTYAWKVLLGAFTKILYTEGAVLLGMVYNFLPFMILPIYTTLMKLDKSYIEAASDLGANPTATFLRVVLPLSMPGVISGITMVFIPSTTTFAISQLLGGGKTMLYGDLIYMRFITEQAWSTGSALSIILLAFVLLSMAVMRRAERVGHEDTGGRLW